MAALKTLAFSCLVNLIPLVGICQDIVTESLRENAPDWQEGKVQLIDGLELQGSLKFDDHVGILFFQNGEVSKSLTADRCAKFEYYDDASRKHRLFFSLEYDHGGPLKKFYFFELLRSFEGFVVLSKVDPVEVRQRTHGADGAPIVMPDGSMGFHPGGAGFTSTEVRQTETVYFMNEDGRIDPYIRILDKEADGPLLKRKRTKNKFIDESVLPRYTGVHFNKLEAFAAQHELNFKVKQDVLQVLDFYAGLLEQ